MALAHQVTTDESPELRLHNTPPKLGQTCTQARYAYLGELRNHRALNCHGENVGVHVDHFPEVKSSLPTMHAVGAGGINDTRGGSRFVGGTTACQVVLKGNHRGGDVIVELRPGKRVTGSSEIPMGSRP